MKPFLKDLLFGGAGAATRLGDVGLGLLRVGLGLGVALGHGWGKVFQDNGIGPSAGFVRNVGSLGFPAPTFFAWCAALTELFAGLAVALGLLTRPAALLLVFNMAVAAFLRHADDPVFGSPGKELALLYLFPFLALLLMGAGRYSVDASLRRRL